MPEAAVLPIKLSSQIVAFNLNEGKYTILNCVSENSSGSDPHWFHACTPKKEKNKDHIFSIL
jgi:hypothetical protein